MKKIFMLLVDILILINTVGCSAAATQQKTDYEAVKEKGVLNVGMAEFTPMDYRSGDDWIGFDADMTKAFCEYLGVDVNFVVIDWDYKTMELNSGNIDCVWNGMSITNEILESMDVSNAYCRNAQVVLVRNEDADKYDELSEIKDLTFVVEAGSSGESTLKDMGYEYITVPQQSDAVLEVASGISEACVVDLLMAAVLTREGASYDNLSYTLSLCDEQYAVGFRKGSDLVEKMNSFLKETYDDGTIQTIAERYGLEELILEQE